MPVAATTEEIRRHFPALERIHAGYPVAYFDGPGGTQVPRQVREAISDYLLHHNPNTHWVYATSGETDALLAASRVTFADWVNAAPEETVFGANMTTLTFHLGRALSREWRPGDAILITELDHNANSDTWRCAAQESGVEVRCVRLRTEDGRLDESDLERKLTPEVRLVAVGAASNALGTVNDVAKLTARAHAVGALVFVDGVHYSAHQLPDARQWGCDFFVCSAYRFYGPHVGVLWGRHELLESLDAPRLAPAGAHPPESLETETLNHEGIVDAAAAVDYLAGLGGTGGSRRSRLALVCGELHSRGDELLRQMWDALAAVPGVRLYGPAPGTPRTSTLSFTFQGHPPEEVAAYLATRGIFASHGDFYAATVAERYGQRVRDFVRAGCAAYTTSEEVARLTASVAAMSGGLAGAAAAVSS